jgi:hypothetical protein
MSSAPGEAEASNASSLSSLTSDVSSRSKPAARSSWPMIGNRALSWWCGEQKCAAIWLGYLIQGEPAGAQSTPGTSPSTVPSVQQNNQGPGQQFNAPSSNIYVNPTPALPQRDPDGIYHLDRRVGTAVVANKMLPQGKIIFGELYGVNELNDRQPFDYQDYVLKFVSANGKPSLMEAMTLIGVSITGTMQQNIVPRVECEIIASRRS